MDVDPNSKTSCCLLAKSCLTLGKPTDLSLPGSSIHGISQAIILEWVAIFSSRDLPDPGIKSVSPVWAGGFFTIELQGTALELPSSGPPCNSLDSALPCVGFVFRLIFSSLLPVPEKLQCQKLPDTKSHF